LAPYWILKLLRSGKWAVMYLCVEARKVSCHVFVCWGQESELSCICVSLSWPQHTNAWQLTFLTSTHKYMTTHFPDLNTQIHDSSLSWPQHTNTWQLTFLTSTHKYMTAYFTGLNTQIHDSSLSWPQHTNTWQLTFLCICVLRPGKWAVMYLCVEVRKVSCHVFVC
jgi:hypothetical protein